MSEVAIVTCLFNGNKTTIKLPYGAFHYDTTWVDKLYRQVARNTTLAFDFICLVDEPDYEFSEPDRSDLIYRFAKPGTKEGMENILNEKSKV